MNKNYTLIVIGSGPGGYVAAIRASQLGMKVAIIEKESLGGICLNWGCIPTKALLKSAQVFDYIKHSESYGIVTQDVQADLSSMVKRSRNVANNMSKGVEYLLKKNCIDVIYGVAKLDSNKNIVVLNTNSNTQQKYQSQHIIVATGGRNRNLPKITVDNKKIISYKEAMILNKQPKSMVIIGGGAIGTEFAYFYHTIGTKVTMIEYMPRLLPSEDEGISKELAKIFSKSDIKIQTSTEVIDVESQGDKCLVKIKNEEGVKTITCEVVLSAVGIQSNIEGIGLEDAGIIIEQGKIKVDDHYNTNVPGICAIGDVIKGPALAHVASAEGIVCVEQICGINSEPLNYNNLPACIYCQPEIASVGYTEKEALEAGYKIKVGEFPFSASGKAHAVGLNQGFVKVIFDEKYGEWLGAHIIGANATEMIAEVVAARKLETTAHEIIKTVHPHPTMSEAVMEAVANAYDEAIHL